MILYSEFDVGEFVYDSLTLKQVKIIGVCFEIGRQGFEDTTDNIGSFGYWVEDPWLGGGRHPWEIQKIK